MNDQTYNGWSNYETWVTKLWLDNDQVTNELMLGLAYTAKKSGKTNKAGLSAGYLLAQTIEEFIESERDDMKASMFADLLNHAIAQIDFREIAESYLEDLES